MSAKWISMVLLAGGLMEAKTEAETSDPSRVTVCVASSIAAGDFGFARARAIAGKMFAGAGVRIVWLEDRSCPADAIRVSFAQNVPASQFPGALAYALPYEGTHIVVFYDRVRVAPGSPKRVPSFLAHVLVHEIAHVLQGVSRHSESGVMKANWTENDYSEMAFKPLAFTELDVKLLHDGLASRQNRIPAQGEVASR